MNFVQHIAIIPDGNRRWAKENGLPSFMGHREGAKIAEKILKAALDLKIPYVTFWGASVDNVTKRDSTEVQFLFTIFEEYFKKIAESKVVHENQVKVSAFGEWRNYFSASCKKAIENAIEKTRDYSAYHLNFLLAYSGYEEILSAINKISELKKFDSDIIITKDLVKENLFTKNMPAVDLVIRTGGEPHFSSGFMMWDIAEAYLYFTNTPWPSFTQEEFEKAIGEFQNTEKRKGK